MREAFRLDRRKGLTKIEGSVDPGVNLGTRTYTATVVSQRLSPPLTQSSVVTGQMSGYHDRSGIIHGDFSSAFPYRVVAAKFTPTMMDFQYQTGVVTKSTWRRTGLTPVAAPVGAGISPLWGTRTSGGLRVPDVSVNMENRAITEALNKLQDGKMEVLVSIAEARESIDFIASSVGRIVRSFQAARKRRWNQAFRILSGSKPGKNSVNAGGNWLSYQYAVLPLLGDIQGAFALVHQGLKDVPVLRARRLVSGPYGLPPFPAHFVRYEVAGKCDVGVEVCLEARLTNPIISLLGQMGLYNPFAVAWELVPYSFVIDWLIPIGNTLSALTATQGLQFHDGYINWKLVSDFTWKGVNIVPLQGGTLPGGRVEAVAQWRRSLIDFPSPRLYIKSPFSTSHVLSAIALLAQIRR